MKTKKPIQNDNFGTIVIDAAGGEDEFMKLGLPYVPPERIDQVAAEVSRRLKRARKAAWKAGKPFDAKT